MQKKILLTLLMASPTALPTLADINFGPGTWVPTGMGEPGKDFNYTPETGTVDNTLGTGKMVQTVSLQPGKYILSFTSTTNLKVTVTQSGKDLAVNEDGALSISFEVKTAGDVKIETQGKTANQFSFANASLALDFDFVKAGSDLQVQYDKLTDLIAITDDEFPGAAELDKEKAVIEGRKTAIKEAINRLLDAEGLNETPEGRKTLEDLYKIYTLYVTPTNGAAEKLNEIEKDIVEWNKKATDLNNEIETTATNNANKATLTEGQGELATAIDALIKKITEGSAYASNLDLAAANDLKTEIENFGQTIEAAFPADKLADAVIDTNTLEATKAALETKLNELSTKWENDEADWNAYNTYMNSVFPGLQNAANSATVAINALIGVKGQENIFDEPEGKSVKDGYVAQIDKIFNDAKKNLQINQVSGARELLEADQQTVNTAVEEMETLVNGFKETIAKQNENYTTATTQENAFLKTLKECELTTVPEQIKDSYNEAYAAAEKAIKDFGDANYDAYSKAELDIEAKAYTTAVANIEKLLDDLKNIVAPAAELDLLNTSYTDLVEYIKGLDEDLDTDIVNIYGLFSNTDGVLPSIKNAIDNLKDNDEVEAQKVSIEDALVKAKVTADDLHEVFGSLIKANTQYGVDLAAFEKFVDTKIELNKNGNTANVLKTAFMEYVKDGKDNGKGGEFKAAREQFEKDLYSLKLSEENPTPQAIYDKAMEMAKGLKDGEKYTWQPVMESIELEFAQQVTESNMKYLDEYLNNDKDGIRKFVAESTDEVKAAIVFDEIDTKMAAIESAINSADTTAKYGLEDVNIQSLFKSIANIKPNVKAFTEMWGMIAGDEGLQTRIDALKEKNEEESKDGGKEYFEKYIQDNLQTPTDNLKQELTDALKNYADSEKNVTGQKNTFLDRIDVISKNIGETVTAIENNNTFHNQQLNTAETVFAALGNALQNLEDKYNGQELIKEWYDETKGKLESLRDNDLFNNNVAVADAYGKGESQAQNSVLDAEYQRILKEINTIADAINGDYAAAVKAANDKVVSAAEWDKTKADMNAEYLKAIEAYNAYYYGLNNQGWRAEVLPVVERHDGIYQYSQTINNLIAKVQKFIDDANTVDAEKGTPKTFTLDEFNKIATEEANKLIAEMQTEVDNMNKEAEATAKQYYATKYAAAETQINGYKDKLQAAGIVSDCLEDAETALKGAKAKYDVTADPEKATQPLGLAMDLIADDLDEANKPVDLQPVAEKAWTDIYWEAEKTVSGLLAALEDYKNKDEYKFADEQIVNDAISTIRQAQFDMNMLNTQALSVNNLIDRYAGYKTELEEILSGVNAADKSVKDSSAANKESKDLYDELTGTTIPEYLNDISALVEYANSMAGGRGFNGYDNLNGYVNLLQYYTENEANNLSDLKETIEQLKKEFEAALENSYREVAYDEQKWLSDTLLPKLQVAFNDAKAAYMGAEGTTSSLEKPVGEEMLNGWNKEISDMEPVIAALAAEITPEAFKKDEFRKKALEIETTLADIYEALETSWTGVKHENVNPAETALANLQQKYGEVAGTLKEVNDYFAGCEYLSDELKEQYGKDIQKLSDLLEGQPDVWNAAGNRVIDMEPTYYDILEGIDNSLKTTLENLTTANEAAIKEHEKTVANQNAFDRLTAELNTIKERFKKISSLANEWYPEEYDPDMERIANQIASDENRIKTYYENKSLTDFSQLNWSLKNNLNKLETVVSQRKAKDTQAAASRALDAARTYLDGSKKNIVPEEWSILDNTLASYNNDYFAIYNQHYYWEDGVEYAADYQTLLDVVIPGYQKISEECAEFNADVEAQRYVRGDVDLNPDGLVTANDVQIMVGWILDGMTWEQLREQNARQAYAADLNDDQTLNITDVTMDISLVFGEDPTTRALGRFAAPAYEKSESLQIELVSEENGVRRYAIMLNNSVDMIAGQMDIKLPSGNYFKGVTAGERAGRHELQYAEQGFDTVRVVLYSMDNAAIAGNSGAVIYVDVEGTGEIKAENTAFTDTYFVTHEMQGAGSSFIDSVIEGAKDVKTRFYNAAGMMFNKLQNGINIFRGADGKVKKEYHRNK